MQARAKIISTTAMSVLLAGCQGSSEVSSDPGLETPSEMQHEASGSVAERDVEAPFATARVATLWVKGLACPYCVQNIDRQISRMPGVERVHVDLPTGKVRVALAAQNPATRDQLVKAIDDSGFTLDRVEMPQ